MGTGFGTGLTKLTLMIKNYCLLFFRNLKRQKLFSIINLLGLTVSIVSTMLIYMYVREEFSFDRFHADAENIYRVNQTFIWGDNTDNEFGSTGPGVATALKEELPELKLITSLHTPGNFIVSYEPPKGNSLISFEETKILAADTNFFRMFNFPIVAGDTHDPLRQAQTLVMTESTAKKYFGSENPVGKQVRLGNLGAGSEQKTFEVTAVVKDLPDNTYFDFDILLSMNSFPQIKRLYWSWVWTQLETYVQLDPRTPLAVTKAKLATIPRKYAEETLQRAMNTSFDEYTKSGKKWELFLQPLTRIHLPDGIVFNRIGNSGNIFVVNALIIAAIFIILLSCVNFMNLSTAQFTRRIKEASVRKILGLGKKELSVGYFAEALIFCTLGLITAIVAAQILLPGFNYITGKHLELNLLQDTNLLAALGILVLLMAIVSSSYPAFFLSGFNPVEAIKGKLKSGREGRLFRNGLVVFQFLVSIFLILSTCIMYQQLDYMTDRDPGFDRQNLMVLQHVEGIADEESFVQQLAGIPGVESASLCSSVPPALRGGDKFTAQGMNDQTFSLNYTMGDEKYIPTLNIKMKYGRNFDLKFPGDENRVIVNEAAIRRIGWELNESVIGRKLHYPGGDDKDFEIAGVVSDFNYWSLASPIEPMGIFHIKDSTVRDSENRFAVIRLSATTGRAWNETIEAMEKVWKSRAEGTPFQYQFTDMAFADQFKSQAQVGSVITIMAVLAIMIASLGLLGMIIYSLEQRSKEIGIRKVSGASVFNILTLISKGYAQLIVIAFILGAPLSWYVMHLWVKQFSYRATPSPLLYAAVGLGILALAGLITGYHSFKAARMNPVNVLRDE